MTHAEGDGIASASLDDDDLERELAQLHHTRHETFLHGSGHALSHHTERTAELEAEWVRRHPERQVAPGRLRTGARNREVPRDADGGQPTTG